MQSTIMKGSSRSVTSARRAACTTTTKRLSLVVRAAAQDPVEDSHGDWSSALSQLQQRIEQVRQAHALHMLEHRYTPSSIADSVDEAMQARPDLAEGAHTVAMWHENAWAKLAADLDQ